MKSPSNKPNELFPGVAESTLPSTPSISELEWAPLFEDSDKTNPTILPEELFEQELHSSDHIDGFDLNALGSGSELEPIRFESSRKNLPLVEDLPEPTYISPPPQDPSLLSPKATPPSAAQIFKPTSPHSLSEISNLTMVAKPQLKKDFSFSARLELPAFWRRLLAAAFDFAIVFQLAFLLQWLFFDKSNTSEPTDLRGFEYLAFLFDNKSNEIFVLFLCVLVVCIFYYTLFETVWSKTIGKKWMGIMVVDDKGHKLSFFRSLSRNVAFVLSALLFFTGPLWILVDKYYRGFHELLSGTMVVRYRF